MPHSKSSLYVQFVMNMDNEHFAKYAALPKERRDYLFSLWVKRHYPDMTVAK